MGVKPLITGITPPLVSMGDYIIDISNNFQLYQGKESITDLRAIGLEVGTVFLLSCNTVFGTDMFDEAQQFKYDPTVNTMAVGSRYGPINSGGLQWLGCKPHGCDRSASIDPEC